MVCCLFVVSPQELHPEKWIQALRSVAHIISRTASLTSGTLTPNFRDSSSRSAAATVAARCAAPCAPAATAGDCGCLLLLLGAKLRACLGLSPCDKFLPAPRCPFPFSRECARARALLWRGEVDLSARGRSFFPPSARRWDRSSATSARAPYQGRVRPISVLRFWISEGLTRA